MTAPKKPNDHLRQGRRDRLLRELVHDPYHSKRKLPEPTVCPDCGAVFHNGRWVWAERPERPNETPCPACRRVQDKVPAGFLEINGSFLSAHHDEVMNLIRNVEEREKAAHPMKRIMDIEQIETGLLITFTEAHLTRSIGEALHRAYQGELDFQYSDEDTLLRVRWAR